MFPRLPLTGMAMLAKVLALSALSQQVRLIPYGCTNLRMTEMPWIQAESPT